MKRSWRLVFVALVAPSSALVSLAFDVLDAGSIGFSLRHLLCWALFLPVLGFMAWQFTWHTPLGLDRDEAESWNKETAPYYANLFSYLGAFMLGVAIAHMLLALFPL